MKHLTLVVGFVVSLSLPVLAQPGPGGPVQLRNLHRRGGGDGPMGGGPMGGGLPGTMPGGTNGAFGNRMRLYPTPQPAVTAPPVVAMLVDGPYLFALRGDSLFQFDKKAFKLLNSAQLPKSVATPVTPQPDAFTPPGNGYFGGNPAFNHAPATTVASPAVAISADGTLLFVLRGDSLFQFDRKTLKLLNSAELPAPVATTPSTPDEIGVQTSPPLRPGTTFKIGPTF